MAGALALLLGIGFATSPPQIHPPEDAEVRQCREWIAGHSQRPGAKMALSMLLSRRTLCFDGSIYASTLKEALGWADAIAKNPTGRPRFVVRSPGGDADAAMEFAETLQRLDAEVTVVDYCMSSCANYFFAALPRRRVTDGALLLFHGGYSAGDRPMHAAWLDQALRDPALARSVGDPVRWRENELKRFDRSVDRQNALYRRAGVDARVVTGIPSVDEEAIPASDCGARKGAKRAFLFFDAKQLRRLGIAVEDGRPETDPVEADRRLAGFGFSFTACAAPAAFFDARPGQGRLSQ